MSTARRFQPARRQDGALGILYAMILPLMLGMIGLAIDLSMVYARGRELQAVADGAALAAARALDGTPAGLERARNSAEEQASKAEYRFLNPRRINWSGGALSFAASAAGPWIPAGAVSAMEAPTMLFARVDTASLDARYGEVAVAFLRVVGVSASQHMARVAVAGRKETILSPLAVCALNAQEISARGGVSILGAYEAVEYGFRRGVTYNLLRLNPNGSTPRHFLVNPLDFAPAPPLPAHHTDAAVRPFVCSGNMPAPAIGHGSTLYVRQGFPLSMVAELNSRFDLYTDGSTCTPYIAPPDANVRDFRGGYTGFWMTGIAVPVRASAAELDDGNRLVTVADAEGPAAGTTAASYGTLWSFGRPRRYVNGALGTEFQRVHWKHLYPVASGNPPASSYSDDDSPYDRYRLPHFEKPAARVGSPQRRVLNVPLLECPVNGSSARVLGIGRFLMTTPATQAPAGIHAEFGGLTNYAAMTASAVLIQ
ncbi:hypothetical protein KY495_07670 [Massilia sp. PAMC28688]|uniref:pilus assembly protein TadG-related protein n=1 Tax=Massilia sp. PAMC28688 TaxID=2861283 RepID=UPI001C63304A|nr:pilus assembly protein TadG-related protein [Massilia sp. PAMC28688]QYF95030.1 hypothetical protein KY495_07670 [Massilia sp. PAMC28688]